MLDTVLWEHPCPRVPLVSPVALSDDAAPELDQEIPPDSEERKVVVEDDSLAWLLRTQMTLEKSKQPHCTEPSEIRLAAFRRH